MAETRKIVKVFLASPGDMPEERQAAKNVADEFNLTWANALGYQIDLIGWEDTVSTYGRPQATINRDLDQCEYFFGMMWRKWGTPPDTSGKYTSGFEEEFRRSADRHELTGVPQISLVFREVEPDLLKDPGDELKKVLSFKKDLVDGKKILFDYFKDLKEFENKFRRCISQYIVQLSETETKQPPQQTLTSPRSGDSSLADLEADSNGQTPFTLEGKQFLTRLISLTYEEEDQRPTIPAVDVARFRLLAAFIGEQGNDELTLGAHDANLLFAQRATLDLSESEERTLAGTGLRHFSNENVPIWYWVSAVGGFSSPFLQYFSVGPNSRRSIGALHAMSLIGEPLTTDDVIDREFYIKQWLGKPKETREKVAALEYLRDWGLMADLPAIQAEFDRNDTQTARASAEAIVLIHCRDSRDAGIRALIELPVSSVSKAVVDKLFVDAKAISGELLVSALSHPSVDLRRAAAGALRVRKLLSQEIAERLLSDPDAQVTLEGLLSLAENGRDVTDEEAKGALSKKAPTGLLSSAFGQTSELANDQYAAFSAEQTRLKTNAQLRESQKFSDDWGFFDHKAAFEVARRNFGSNATWIRDKLDNRFKSDFDQRVATLVARQSDLADTYLKVEEAVRKAMCREALDVLSVKGNGADISRVRGILESGFVAASGNDIAFLGRFGEWRDIPLLIRLSEPPPTSLYLLSILSDSPLLLPAAGAIVKLADQRLNELLALSIPANLLRTIVALLTIRQVRTLNSGSLSRLLQFDSDGVRKFAAIQLVRALPKKQLKQFFDKNAAAEELRFYNVVHWLDFGVSVPHARATAAARKLLAAQA